MGGRHPARTRNYPSSKNVKDEASPRLETEGVTSLGPLEVKIIRGAKPDPDGANESEGTPSP